MSTTQPALRSVAIATARYQLAFWLAEGEGCPPESGTEYGGPWVEILTRRERGRERKSEREGMREGSEGQSDDGQGGKEGERR